MKTAADIVLIVFLFGLFGFVHTYLASNKIKKSIAERTGVKIAFYRFFYNVISVITFLALLEVCPKPDQLIYELHYPYDMIIFILQAISLAGVVWSFYCMDFKELMGISQVKRYYAGVYVPEHLDADQKLEIKGAYRISRHPLYFFMILFFGLRPYMDLFYLVSFVCCTVYCFIGAYYEEKKLVERFGDEYSEYKKRVSRIFPLKIYIKRG